MSAAPVRVALPIAAGVPPSPIPFRPTGIRDSAVASMTMPMVRIGKVWVGMGDGFVSMAVTVTTGR